jgi:hypothetical protein
MGHLGEVEMAVERKEGYRTRKAGRKDAHLAGEYAQP